MPRRVTAGGHIVETAIFKEPVSGSVRVARLNLDGDRQADLTVHGGAEKAVYAYPSEHYPYWREQLGTELSWAAFGENLTTAGLTEANLHIGDVLQIGSAEFVVTQPRTPCYKLNIRFDRPDMVKRFHRSGKSGFYLAVTREGHITAGDEIVIASRDAAAISVAQIVQLFEERHPDPELLRRVSELAALPENWRDYFAGRVH
ncbi:MAG TPA: MOSC domain-containing protein [Thermoanaerobaculia bacterium]|nr:MOSC domain-containing protein [Thermoanaerobaculia bacterium]